MTRARTRFLCADCGAVTASWTGRCHICDSWGTVSEQAAPGSGAVAAAEPVVGPVDLPVTNDRLMRPTGIDELDRLLGGGLMEGSVTLLGGEPGVGKSTLLLQVLAASAETGQRVLLVSGEESRPQIRRRAERLGALHPGLELCCTTDAPTALQTISDLEPAMAVVDSAQTFADPACPGGAGSVAQVRALAGSLVERAKATGTAVVLVGHVTKDGSLAGPRQLEHLVDTVVTLDGDRHHALRLLRASKHRFGATGDVAVFSMGPAGLEAVADPSALLLADRRPEVAGSVVAPVLDGRRPVLVEVQALAAPTTFSPPRRIARGVEGTRLAMLLAVLERWAGLPTGSVDVWVSVAGGLRLNEPGGDLSVALAVASSLRSRPVPHDLAVCAEVGLGGELRQVAHTEQRLAEAARAGFTRVLVAPSAPEAPPRCVVIRAHSVAEALAVAGLDRLAAA